LGLKGQLLRSIGASLPASKCPGNQVGVIYKDCNETCSRIWPEGTARSSNVATKGVIRCQTWELKMSRLVVAPIIFLVALFSQCGLAQTDQLSLSGDRFWVVLASRADPDQAAAAAQEFLSFEPIVVSIRKWMVRGCCRTVWNPIWFWAAISRRND